MDSIRAAGGGLWLMGAVLSGYGDERYLRTGQSGGGFRSSAENRSPGGRLGLRCGDDGAVGLGRSFQPLICCRVRIQTSMPTGSLSCQGNIASGDVTPAVGRGGQETQAGEVLDAGDAGAARGGPLDDRVLGRQGGKRSRDVV